MNEQNSCLMITAYDEDNKGQVYYIPMALDSELLNAILENGSNCENKDVVMFDVDTDEKTFWNDMWEGLK